MWWSFFSNHFWLFIVSLSAFLLSSRKCRHHSMHAHSLSSFLFLSLNFLAFKSLLDTVVFILRGHTSGSLESFPSGIFMELVVIAYIQAHVLPFLKPSILSPSRQSNLKSSNKLPSCCEWMKMMVIRVVLPPPASEAGRPGQWLLLTWVGAAATNKLQSRKVSLLSTNWPCEFGHCCCCAKECLPSSVNCSDHGACYSTSLHRLCLLQHKRGKNENKNGVSNISVKNIHSSQLFVSVSSKI